MDCVWTDTPPAPVVTLRPGDAESEESSKVLPEVSSAREVTGAMAKSDPDLSDCKCRCCF